MKIDTMNADCGWRVGGNELAPGDDADDRQVDQEVDPATASVLSRIERGMTRPGFATSSPM
jgi:hypothetical protein